MTNLPTQKLGSPRILYIISFSLIIMVIFAFIIVYQARNGYTQAIVEGEEKSERMAEILAKHVELSFLGVDVSLRRAIERSLFNELSGSNNKKYTEQNFNLWINESPQITALALINSKGEMEAAAYKKEYNEAYDYKKVINSEKLLEYMRNAKEDELFIGRKYIKGNNSVIIMSRRYNKINGDFAGIVVAAVDPEYFVNFYETVAFGTKKFMSIMLYDGTVLASGSYNSFTNEAIGRDYFSSQEKKPNSSYKKIVNIDDSKKILAIKILNRTQIAVQVITDESDFLMDWKKSLLKDMGLLGLLVILVVFLLSFSLFMASQIGKIQKSENAAILASQAKSEFLANMSHELRTPLNAIIGFSEMMISGYFGLVNEKQKERIYDINLCGSHLLQLITDILEFSKGDAGKLELVEEKIALYDLVNESVRIMQEKIKGKGIELRVEVQNHLPMLWGDKRKLRQVMINLLSNAFKFTPEQGIITVTAALEATDCLFISVTDTGVGISEADIPKALSVFGQVHRSKKHEGTGLGLPLCKMYAELHNGKLLLTSKQNHGTTVKIIFPHQRTLRVGG